MWTALAEKDTATVTSKGQVTIPKSIREQFGIEPGTKLQFVRMPSGHLEVVPKTGRIEDLFGIIKSPHPRLDSIEEMNEAIAEAAAESGMRGMESHDSPEWEEEGWERQ